MPRRRSAARSAATSASVPRVEAEPQNAQERNDALIDALAEHMSGR